MQPQSDRSDDELVALALETRRVAESIGDAALCRRLMEIADEILGATRPTAPLP